MTPDNSSPIQMLVVDDEPTVRESVARWFTARGYRVDQAENGRRAVEMCRARQYDIVSLDVDMPDIGGIEIMEHLQGICPETRFIVLTGLTQHSQRALQRGAAKALTKPLRMRDLQHEIEQLLDPPD